MNKLKDLLIALGASIGSYLIILLFIGVLVTIFGGLFYALFGM